MSRTHRLYSDREIRARNRGLIRLNRFTETGEGLRVIRDGQDITADIQRLAAVARDPGVAPTHVSPTTQQ